MFRKFSICLSIAILAGLGLVAEAAESTLEVIPQSASLVIRFKKPQAILGKAADMVNQVVPGAGDILQQQGALLGQVISNPTMAGVDMEGDWCLALFTNAGSAGGTPKYAAVVSGTDLKAMQEALGGAYQFAEKGKLGIYTDDAAVFKLLTSQIQGDGKSISALIDADSSTVFGNGDISVFINVPQLVTDYKSQLESARGDLRQALTNLPAGPAGGAGGVDPAQIAQLAEKVIPIVFDVLNDASSCTIGFSISKEGMTFEDLVRVKEGSGTDKFLSKSSAGQLAALSYLPQGYLAYVGLSIDSTSFAEFNDVVLGMNGFNLKGNDATEMKNILAEISKLKMGSRVVALGIGDSDDGAARQVGITEVDNPAKYRELSLKLVKLLEKAEHPNGMKQTITVKKDAEKFGTNSGDMIVVKTDFGDSIPDPAAAEMVGRFMSVFFGPEGATSRIVSQKDRLIETMGGGKQAMTDALAALEKKPGTVKSPTEAARAKLSPNANVVFLFDLPNALAKILDLMVQNQLLPFPLPLDSDQVKQLQSKPSYFSFSAGIEPRGIRVKTIFPVEQAQGIAKIVLFFQQSLGGGQ
jgi:hypothetical protein